MWQFVNRHRCKELNTRVLTIQPRYSYDTSYIETLEDVAASLGLKIYYQIVQGSFLEFSIGVTPNTTVNIAVRGFSTKESASDSGYPGIIWECNVKIPNAVPPTAPAPVIVSGNLPWMSFVILPIVVVIILTSATLYIRYRKKRKNRILTSRSLYDNAADWTNHRPLNTPKYSHYVVTASDCWTPLPTDCDTYSEDNGSPLNCDSHVFRYRHSLTTVTEESSLLGDGLSTTADTHYWSREKSAAKQPKPHVTRLSTPRTPRSKASRRNIWSRSSKVSDASSISLWWADDDDYDVIELQRNRTHHAQRRHRRVSPHTNVETQASGLQRIGTPAVVPRQHRGFHSTTKPQLRATTSSMNVLTK
uniref:uncharacterized protein LOC113474679 n=1 Tax=Ciona intestinalis TaxID=7719 RepID=UPI000EF54DA0|nr:uncharacterized protein LOC113474679 [Ciona intestinalis]|eukprot:XP_026692483.1 uncharacterized protein LOC113474679 [Ciona intestinalis]